MNRFIIGQYGGFDYHKHQRDFRAGFYGVEACLFSHDEDIVRLKEQSQNSGFKIGIHFPLRAGISPIRDALFLSTDSAVRLKAYDLIQRELDYLASAAVNPDYILFHYPKPVILDHKVDWSKWRFSDRSEYENESSYPRTQFQEHSHALLEWLSDQGREYNFTPVLEFDGLNRYIYEEDFLENMLVKHPDIRLCLDTLRLYWQERIDSHFEAAAVIRRYARFAETVHLSTVQISEGLDIMNSRYPVLPTQKPSEGWAPIEQYLTILHEENKNVKIMFEHQSQLVSDQELQQCYDWVEQLIC